MDSQIDWHAARAALEWQLEMGVTETISERPSIALNRLRRRRSGCRFGVAALVPVHAVPEVDPVAEAEAAARAAPNPAALQAAMAAYPHCELQKGARNLGFGWCAGSRS
ncbi:hypothetical protein [Marivita cryptomonadis]|uniref:hypothetical protein n=1 Tax=Marivita cryptomonadis TaxID=505252 RepID=UPI00391BE658